MPSLAGLTPSVRQYLLVTGNYWAFTLTDGALRMLVVLYFYQLGYGALQIALLFLFYETFGVITNLVGGWLGARIGLNRTMNIGLGLQVFALLMLTVSVDMLSVPWVMAAQALSGVAKDLNKMSAKSAIKTLVPAEQRGRLFRWVALFTGSKNALKGAGFFIGGTLLAVIGFRAALFLMAAALALVWIGSLLSLDRELGRARARPAFTEIWSKSRAINCLSAARLFLFGARDVWFVVALPVYLSVEFGWGSGQVGGLLAAWVIGYGAVQAATPALLRSTGGGPAVGSVAGWAVPLAVVPAAMAVGLMMDVAPLPLVVGGLALFGLLFAINSALHSYFIVAFARGDGVSLDVGFYYMSNALGRLLGTLLSGWVYQQWGMAHCLAVSAVLIAVAAAVSLALPRDVGTPA